MAAKWGIAEYTLQVFNVRAEFIMWKWRALRANIST